MRFRKAVLAGIVAASMAVPLVGCADTESDSSSQEEIVEASSGDISGNLTQTVELAGVQFDVDPTWTDETSSQTSLRFDPSSSCVVATHVYANGETETLESFKQIDGIASVDFEVEDSWEKDGVAYNIVSGTTTGGDFYSYLFGCDQDGVGFYVFFNMGDSAVTDANIQVRDELFESVSFTPSEALDAISQVDEADESADDKSDGGSPTLGESNALSMAGSYLDTMPFSYSGLIDQLEYEGFTEAEAT